MIFVPVIIVEYRLLCLRVKIFARARLLKRDSSHPAKNSVVSLKNNSN